MHLVVCTDGGKGTFDPTVKSRKLVAARSAELEESSAVIGLASVTNLGYPDGELLDSDAFRRVAGRMGAAAATRGRVRA